MLSKLNAGEQEEYVQHLISSFGKIAHELRHLGNGDAATGGVGAIEGLSMIQRDGYEKVSDSLNNVADAIRELAQAVSKE